MHQSIPAVPIPLPPGAFAHVSVPGVGHLKFYYCPGVGHLHTPRTTPGHLNPCQVLVSHVIYGFLSYPRSSLS